MIRGVINMQPTRIKIDYKRQKLWIVWFIILMILILGGCSRKTKIDQDPTIVPTQTLTPTITITPVPTLTPTPVPEIKRWIPMNQEKTLFKLPLDIRIIKSGSIMDICEWYGDLLVITTTEGQMNFFVCDLDTGLAKNTLCVEAEILDYEAAGRTKKGEYRCYDSKTNEFLYINRQLEITDRVQVKLDEGETPIITEDKKVVYYLRFLKPKGMELVKRVLKTGEELTITKGFESFEGGSLGGLLFDDSLILVSGYSEAGRYFYVDLDKFQVYKEEEVVNLNLKSEGNMYGGITSNTLPELIFGNSKNMQETYCISYENRDECYAANFLFDEKLLSTSYSEYNKDATEVVYYYTLYDLETGHRLKKTSLKEANNNGYLDKLEAYFQKEQVLVGTLYHEKGNCIYLWDLSAITNESDLINTYICPYYQSDIIDHEMLGQLQTRADEIGKRYGVNIKLGENCRTDFSDYSATLNYEVRLIRETLDELESVLEEYPKDFFEQLGEYGKNRLSIYLIGQMKGLGGNTLSTAAALYNGYMEQYIAVDCTQYTSLKQNLYHELSHAIDMYMEKFGDCYDYGNDWNMLNPKKFIYEYSYEEDLEISYDQCLCSEDPEEIYFIDTYAKTYPTEDRARLMEYVLLNGIDTYQKYPHLMKKLEAMYEEIYSCFDTTNWKGDFFEFDDTFGVIENVP